MTTSFVRSRIVEIAYVEGGRTGAPKVIVGTLFCAGDRFWGPHLPACEGFTAVCFNSYGHRTSGRGEGLSTCRN